MQFAYSSQSLLSLVCSAHRAQGVRQEIKYCWFIRIKLSSFLQQGHCILRMVELEYRLAKVIGSSPGIRCHFVRLFHVRKALRVFPGLHVESTQEILRVLIFGVLLDCRLEFLFCFLVSAHAYVDLGQLAMHSRKFGIRSQSVPVLLFGLFKTTGVII